LKVGFPYFSKYGLWMAGLATKTRILAKGVLHARSDAASAKNGKLTTGKSRDPVVGLPKFAALRTNGR
jgi:hypothetical protein